MFIKHVINKVCITSAYKYKYKITIDFNIHTIYGVYYSGGIIYKNSHFRSKKFTVSSQKNALQKYYLIVETLMIKY